MKDRVFETRSGLETSHRTSSRKKPLGRPKHFLSQIAEWVTLSLSLYIYIPGYFALLAGTRKGLNPLIPIM